MITRVIIKTTGRMEMGNMTMKELAKLAGVSRPAVSAVLGNTTSCRVSPKTREKIKRLVRKLNFVPNEAARQLNGSPTRLIGLVSASSNIGMTAVLQTEIITILHGHGFEILVSHMSSDKADPADKLNEFRARRVNGIVALNLPLLFKQMENYAIPTVYLSSQDSTRFDVSTDRNAGGYLAARHLLEHERVNPVYISLGGGFSNKEKYCGFRQALKEKDYPVLESNYLILEYGTHTSEVVKCLKSLKADSIFCCNDYAAAKMAIALQQAGYRIPDDMAIIGFDGYSFCDFTPVPLATILQPVRQQAEIAVKLLMDRIKNEETQGGLARIRLVPILRPSASCGCSVPEPDQLSGVDSVLIWDKLNPKN